VGPLTQSGIPGQSLLRQDGIAAATAHYAAVAAAAGSGTRDSANHERPREDWIEVSVPALVSEEIFALALEQLEKNKHHAPRRTIEPTPCRGCWNVNSVAMLCTGHPREPPNTKCITIAASDRMDIGG
jgi:hypothetical protein